jgi:hypothetical protein
MTFALCFVETIMILGPVKDVTSHMYLLLGALNVVFMRDGDNAKKTDGFVQK